MGKNGDQVSTVKRIAIALIFLCTGALALADTPESLFRQAAQSEREGQITRAIEEFEQFLKEFPRHSQVLEARYRLARNLDRIGKLDEAIEQLERVVRKQTDRFKNRQEALYLLGKLLGTVANYDRATEIFEHLLTEGAGLYEEEVLHLCGGYYAIQGKYDEAGTKFNILARRRSSKYAEQAAYKLAMVWIKAGHMDLAVDAVSQLATHFPENEQARGLMLQIADSFRRQRKYDQSVAICEQLRTGFPKTREGQGAGYVLAMCYLDRGEIAKAAETFETISRLPENRKSGLAAEAMLQAADIHFTTLSDPEKAMDLYEEASKLARADTSERQRKILEQCYFRLGEHYFAKQKWAVALEYYSLLRGLGTEINILPRIMKCQGELNIDIDASVQSEKEIGFLKKKIAENPGTFAAAEGEVFLADRRLNEIRIGTPEVYDKLAQEYRRILDTYPADVLAQHHLESYTLVQLGRCHEGAFRTRAEAGVKSKDWEKAITAFEKAEDVDRDTPYTVEILEHVARVADAAGQVEKAFKTYKRLYEISEKKLEENKDDAAVADASTEYLRSMLSRADTGSSIDRAIGVARDIIRKKGAGSDAARHSMFYLGELQYLKKDFSAAAATYRDFVKQYGPAQDAGGNVAGGPWKPSAVDARAKQVFEGAVRIAHCWYMQGHTPNMLKAYRWLIANFPNSNRFVGEAQYWLAMELAKGEQGKTEANKRKLAETLWKKVVNPSFDFAAPGFPQKYYPWTRDKDIQEYAKSAMVRAGELYSKLGEHELAAGMFEQYVRKYPPRAALPGETSRQDELYSIARYALGREYAALNENDKLVDCFLPYTRGMRDDRFRLSALQILGYQASKHDLYYDGIRAYATILDEYGTNRKDKDGKVISVPAKERIRRDGGGWNGIRTEPPPDLDLGEIRYALGFIYWKMQDWKNCSKILWPFIRDPALEQNKVRAKALFMVGRAYFRMHDYDNGQDVMDRLVTYYPRFEAVDEAYVYAATGCEEMENWKKITDLHKRFVKLLPKSPRRQHMDLFLAVAQMGSGKRANGLRTLKRAIETDTYEDVKADAFYHLGVYETDVKARPDINQAFKYFEQSVGLYPRARSCLAGAKTCMKLKKWDRAKVLLDQAVRDFPTADPQLLREARRLVPTVLKELAKGG